MKVTGYALWLAMATGMSVGGAAHAGSAFERSGDVLQIALPIAAAVCSIRNHEFVPYAARFVGQSLAVHGAKSALGNKRINRRPYGGYNGFPSGHTAAAFYGASYIARKCANTRGQKALVFGLATLVGASRIQSDNHTAAQVAAGALVGLAFDNVAVSFTDKRVAVGWRMEF